MQREGSPWQGLGVVFLKEAMDHLTSARMIVLELLVALVAVVTLYLATEQIKDATAEDPFIFLRLFTTSRNQLPSFVVFLGFLVPLMAIGLAFDSVNGEHNRRTMSRILSQPIYRDALLLGKFLGATGDALDRHHRTVAARDRARLVAARRAAGRRGDGARTRVPHGDHRLCGRMARARHAVLDHFPIDGDGGARHPRYLAVPDLHLARDGAGHRAGDPSARSDDTCSPAPDADAALAEHAVQRGGGRDPQPRDRFGRAAALPQPDPRCGGRCAAAARRKAC